MRVDKLAINARSSDCATLIGIEIKLSLLFARDSTLQAANNPHNAQNLSSSKSARQVLLAPVSRGQLCACARQFRQNASKHRGARLDRETSARFSPRLGLSGFARTNLIADLFVASTLQANVNLEFGFASLCNQQSRFARRSKAALSLADRNELTIIASWALFVCLFVEFGANFDFHFISRLLCALNSQQESNKTTDDDKSATQLCARNYCALFALRFVDLQSADRFLRTKSRQGAS